ncbi:MAG: hypothetical protein ACO35C_05360 [Pontimonas sp.]
MIVSLISVVVTCLVVAVTWWLIVRSGGSPAPAAPIVAASPSVPDLVPVASPPAIVDNTSPGSVDTYAGTSAGEVDSEFKLLEFTFEHKLLPGRVPDASTKMVVKPAGFAPFKFVSCQSTGYAIRWMGRYLSLKSSSELAWTTEKQEPNSCFRVVSGYCDGTKYIMLRSLFNNHFLRVDGDTNKLVCVDSPTRNNADQYCWKLASDDPVGMPCGPQFLPDYGRVVNIPCEIKATPPCGEATPGFKSACCLRHPDDPTCAGSVFREVMGRPLAEAALYIKTRQPGLTIKKCEQTDPVCTKLKPFPIPEPDTVVLPYDKKLGIVSGPAFRFV